LQPKGSVYGPERAEIEYRASPQGFLVPQAPLEICKHPTEPGRDLMRSLGSGLPLCAWQGVHGTHRGMYFFIKSKWQFRNADPAKENAGKPRRMKQ